MNKKRKVMSLRIISSSNLYDHTFTPFTVDVLNRLTTLDPMVKAGLRAYIETKTAGEVRYGDIRCIVTVECE